MTDIDIAELTAYCRRAAPTPPVSFTVHRWAGLVGQVALAVDYELSSRSVLGPSTASALGHLVAEVYYDEQAAADAEPARYVELTTDLLVEQLVDTAATIERLQRRYTGRPERLHELLDPCVIRLGELALQGLLDMLARGDVMLGNLHDGMFVVPSPRPEGGGPRVGFHGFQPAA